MNVKIYFIQMEIKKARVVKLTADKINFKPSL